MIVDTSALVAIIRGEPESGSFAAALHGSDATRMSAATYVETGIVVDSSRDPFATRRIDVLIERARIRIESVTAEQARIARQAYRDFGKGSGHPAQLNFGDCFSYALAIDADEPLLFKGTDFTHTDVTPA